MNYLLDIILLKKILVVVSLVILKGLYKELRINND